MSEIFNIPSLYIFNNDWNLLLKFIENEGNPPFHIDSDLDLTYRYFDTLGTLVSVNGNVRLEQTTINSLGSLEYVTGRLTLDLTKNLPSLGNLKWVGALSMRNTEISDLGELTEIKGDCWLTRSEKLKTLGKLKSVSNTLYANGSSLESLGDLESIGENGIFDGCKFLTSAGKLNRVGGSLDFEFCYKLESLGNLEYVGENLRIYKTEISSIGKLKYIGGDIYRAETPLSNIPYRELIKLVKIGQGEDNN